MSVQQRLVLWQEWLTGPVNQQREVNTLCVEDPYPGILGHGDRDESLSVLPRKRQPQGRCFGACEDSASRLRLQRGTMKSRSTIPGEVRRGAGDCAGIESLESLDFSGRLEEYT